MIKVKDGYAKLIGTTAAGSAERVLLSNGGDKVIGNASGNIPISNGTVCTNLNADKLDGKNANSFIYYISGMNNDTTTSNVQAIGYGYNTDGWKNSGPALSIGASSGYIMQILQAASSHAIFTRYGTPDGFSSEWKQIAFTDSNITGNAASATKLQTARTLWGLSFDGTANVSGNMSNVGSITFSSLSGTTGRALLYLSMGDNDLFRLYCGATASNSGWVELATADDGQEPIYVRQYSGVFTTIKRTATLLDASGNTSFPGTVTATKFIGPATYLECPDTRSTSMVPSSYSAGLYAAFKSSAVTGLSASYSGVISFRPYSSASDWTGGPMHLLAFDSNGIHYRNASSDTWGSWSDLLTTTYYSDKLSGFVTSYTASLSSYWCKLWDVTRTDIHNDLDMTFYIHSSYDNLRGFVHLKARRNSTTTDGVTTYSFDVWLKQISGNLPKANLRLYHNATSGNLLLWCNVSYRWGVYNCKVISCTTRTSKENLPIIGTLYSTSFTTALTLPTDSYVELTNVYEPYYVTVSLHTTNNTEYPLVWSNSASTSSTTGNLLYKSYSNLTYNPSANRITATLFKGSLGDGTMTIKPERNNEVNFGGTNNSSTIYFGYRATDSKPIPTKFVFGSNTGTAEIVAAKITTPLVQSTGVLTLNGVSGIHLKYNNTNAASLVLTDTYFKPFDTANGTLDLGISRARWKGMYANTGDFSGTLSANTSTKVPFTTTTTLYYTRKNLNWLDSSYLEYVILLIPVLTTANWSGLNYIDGRFLLWKKGGNVYDVLEVNLNCVYNSLKYTFTCSGDHASSYKLCRCFYGGVEYYAIHCPYHANPYNTAEFYGSIKSNLTGGTSTVALPLLIAYYNRSTSTVLNEEVNSSINTTLTNSIVTSVNCYGVRSIGGFTGNILGNASSATKLNIARKLWGKSFDGTADIKGLITIGEALGTNPAILFPNGEFINGYGNIYIDKTNSSSWNVGVNDSGTMTLLLTVLKGGNVGVGTSSPSYKLHVNGSAGVSTLKLTSTSQVEHLMFSRGGYNYVTAPSGGNISFMVNGKTSCTSDNCELVILDGSLNPGTTNVTTLGTSSLRWSNIYSVTADLASSSYSILKLTRSGSTNEALITFSNSTGVLGHIGMTGSSTNASLYRYTSNADTSYIVWDAGNDGSESGLDADLLDGTHKSGLLTDLSSSETTNLSITVGGTSKTITNLHAHYLDTLGNKAASDLSSTYPKGLSVAGIYNNGWPFTYGATITAKGNGGMVQFAGSWSGSITSSTNNDYATELYLRNRRDSYDIWSTWTKVLSNKNSSVSGGGSSVGSSITVNIGGTSKTLTIPNTSTYTNYLKIHDVRGTNHLPTSDKYPEYNITGWFNNTGTPTSNWTSGITVRGWYSGYTSWQLASYSDTGTTNSYNLYFRHGNSSWGSWKTILDSSNYKDVIGAGSFWKVNALTYNGSSTSVGTGDIYLEMWRGTAASWKMINTSGTLKFQCNYTSAAGSYYDALTVAYNSGNVWAKGNINTAAGYITSSTILYLDSAASCSIIFRPGGTEKVRILRDSGYVGILTTAPSQALHVAGNAIATNFGVNSTAGSGQGISLYGGSEYVSTYGIAFVTTGNWGTHGYVTGDWATYFTMSNTENRGWIFRRYGSGNVLSIDCDGHLYANGLVNASRFNSRVDTGTLPYACTSTTLNTNLNADLLDGLHASKFYENGYVMFGHTIDASGLNADTWYPVTIPIGAHHTVRIEVRVSLNSGTKPAWSTHNSGFSVRKIWEVNGSGWGTNRINRRILESDYTFASSDPVRGVGQLSNDSIEYVYVRGGGKYFFYISHNITPTLRTSTYTNNSLSVAPTTTAPSVIGINVGAYCSSAGTVAVQDSDYNSTYRMVCHSGNSLYSTAGIYCNPSTYCLYATHYYESSDIRYKTVINNLVIKANQLANLPLFDFKWKDNENLLNTGTSAQAVQELLPYIVSGEDKLTLDYGVLGTIAGITACKELTEQEKEIEKLKKRVKELEDKLILFNL